VIVNEVPPGALVQLWPENRFSGRLWAGSGGGTTRSARGYTSCPVVYGYHKRVWVECGVGVLLETQEGFWRVLVGGKALWFERYYLEPLGG
jgi:hypothetical protein